MAISKLRGVGHVVQDSGTRVTVMHRARCRVQVDPVAEDLSDDLDDAG